MTLTYPDIVQLSRHVHRQLFYLHFNWIEAVRTVAKLNDITAAITYRVVVRDGQILQKLARTEGRNNVK